MTHYDFRFSIGEPIGIAPAHEEAGAWRAIVAGWEDRQHLIVVPLTGHFGALNPRRIDLTQGANGPSIFASLLPRTVEPSHYEAARSLAFRLADLFNLHNPEDYDGPQHPDEP